MPILGLPVTAVVEGFTNPDSHNLIPFELVMYFLYALPSILVVYIGNFIAQQAAKRKRELEETINEHLIEE